MATETSLGMDLDDPVTQHMRTECARLPVHLTAAEALAAIRENPPAGRVVYFYVVDEEDRLLGVVPTRRLLMSALDRKVGEMMIHPATCIPSTATVFDACEFFILYRLLAFPVVDAENRLLGVVDVELYTDELADLDRREASDDLFQLIGVKLQASQQESSFAGFQNRFPWLIANIAGGIMAAVLSGFFQAELEKVVALALFIPVVLALAESVSIQSVSLSLQRLHGRQPTLEAIFRKLQVEGGTGLFLGIASAACIAATAMVWLGQWKVALCLFGGISGGVTFAAVIGALIPNVLRYLQREPQVASGPIALAATDMMTLTMYFLLARWLFA
ncbi:magnesium transporter [Lignipirellula cremea]|uniref:Magnesium transporter MgtE n=1 Tax=Lignipirellula cremea TaxID=2528010 RepID=A0A518DP13_9BACT|nr:magnesium transporter [Lignipirellula cremea]QDU93582.1 Magnesium transporter MgtE [Lignipirellula cremea]